MPELKIRCKNNQKRISVPFGSNLYDVYRQTGLEMSYEPVCARVNNKIQGMNYRFYNPKDVEFLTLQSAPGMRTYTRTLYFVLAKAVEDLFPQGKLLIGATVSRGYYCELRIGRPVTEADACQIKQRMQEIIDADLPIHRIQCPVEEAIEMFQQRGMQSKVQLLESQDNLYTYYYKLDQSIDYFYGCLLTRTGQLHLFDLVSFYDGLLLRVPQMQNPMELEEMVPQLKMLDVIREHHRWQEILGVRTAGEFNAAILEGRATELINVSEALQAKKLSNIADEIAQRHSRLVLLAGPSSSGKTTTSKRLAILLMACGLRPYTLSTDDYFVNREDTPKDEKGEYDFECIQAVDTHFFNEQMNALLRGEEIELPRYDFPTGKRVFEDNLAVVGVVDGEGVFACGAAVDTQCHVTVVERTLVDSVAALAGEGEDLGNSLLRASKLGGIAADLVVEGSGIVHHDTCAVREFALFNLHIEDRAVLGRLYLCACRHVHFHFACVAMILTAFLEECDGLLLEGTLNEECFAR